MPELLWSQKVVISASNLMLFDRNILFCRNVLKLVWSQKAILSAIFSMSNLMPYSERTLVCSAAPELL